MTAPHATPLLRDVDAADVEWPTDLDAFVRSCGSPTWITQSGTDPSRCRLVVTLLHGNEPSGARAVARWLASGRMPATNVAFYVASVDAALSEPAFTHRHLPDEPDANRTFRAPFAGKAGHLALEVLRRIEQLAPEVVVDLHNTTGHNPSYGVATTTSQAVMALTRLFSPRLVHTDLNLGALIETTTRWAPSVVVECGLAFDPCADEVAWEGLQRLMTLDDLGLDAGAPGLEILHHPLRALLRPELSIAFGREAVDDAGLTMDLDVESYNFRAMDAGHRIGWTELRDELPFVVVGGEGSDIAPELFDNVDGVIRARVPIVPLMMTINPTIAVSDCLFYVARRQ